MASEMYVRKLERGIVVDHIEAGKGILLVDLLELRDYPGVWILLSNVPSQKIGKKDILKIEGMELEKGKLELIALASPERPPTINRIENWEVVEKWQAVLPTKVEGWLKCPNYFCITNDERERMFITSSFTWIDEYVAYRCDYCNAIIKRSEILSYLSK